jgi:hypothetical protein
MPLVVPHKARFSALFFTLHLDVSSWVCAGLVDCSVNHVGVSKLSMRVPWTIAK